MKKGLFSGVVKLFGTKSSRDIEAIQPLLQDINLFSESFSSLSHDALRAQAIELRKKVRASFQGTQKEIQRLRAEAKALPGEALAQKEKLFLQVEQQEKKLNQEIEACLEQVMAEAFALMKETARRFKEAKELVVRATDMDKQLSVSHDFVSVKGEQAFWHNTWSVAGQATPWGMAHYDVQLMGGVVLHRGKIAEMATGEGKTLVATLPAFLNGLTGKGVHIVTVNDYLARRDSEWNAPLFAFHGLTVDCIDKYAPHTEERRKAYLADITYGTNNEFGFDYLRDNMSRGAEERVQRGHHFAMVDEVDSVLIDEARTPLIISGPVGKSDEQQFYDLKPKVRALVESQKRLCSDYLQTAKRLISSGDEKEGGLALFRAHRGLPKSKPLIKYLSETGRKQVLQKTENYYLSDNQRHMKEADEPLLFTIDEKNHAVQLTEKGIVQLSKDEDDKDFFVLPDISQALHKIENSDKSNEDKLLNKEAFLADYKVKSERLHTLQQLLKAYTLYEKDVEYVLMDGKVKLVDEQTGRIMEGRRYSDGLHQALEAKEEVKVEEATQTYATITLQNYFRMYHKLSGMTGTAETEAGELWEIYKLDVVVVPTHKPIARRDEQDKVYKTVREKFQAIVDEILSLREQGRPVLVGTTSVEVSELLSRTLKLRHIPHQVLNAKQHQKEAQIVEAAGQSGAITIATNMAGRGTDIKLSDEARQAGGLAIVGTERHESRRIDRQLRGRSGRQGDPGTSQFFVSLEDNLMRLFGSERMAKWMDRMGLKEGEVIQHSMITKSIARAQRKVEENHFGIRKRLLEYDNVMNTQRSAIYARRRHALLGERLTLGIFNALDEVAEEMTHLARNQGYDALQLRLVELLGHEAPFSSEEMGKKSDKVLSTELFHAFSSWYVARQDFIKESTLGVFRYMQETKGGTIKEVGVPFFDGKKAIEVVCDMNEVLETEGQSLVREFEKAVVMRTIDWEWKEHLREMDDLKQSVQNVVYEQKDPLLIYKFEAFELFKQLSARLNHETLSFLFKARPPSPDVKELKAADEAKRHAQRRLRETKEETFSDGSGSQEADARPASQPARSERLAKRNDKVTVQYHDGTIKEGVKYKRVEEDVKGNRCVIVQVHA